MRLAVGVSGHMWRFEEQRVAAIAREVQRAADRLSTLFWQVPGGQTLRRGEASAAIAGATPPANRGSRRPRP
jgi:hypothetical protein